MKGIRLERMQKELYRILSTAYSMGAHDDRLHSVRITSIKITPDLHYLKISYDYLNKKVNKKQMQELLEKSSGFIKKQIAGAQIMRRIPEISFQYDKTEVKSSHLDKIFMVLEEEKRNNYYGDEDDDYGDGYDDFDENFEEDEYDDLDEDDYDEFEDGLEEDLIDDDQDEDY